MVQAVLFDLDGVLVHSFEAWVRLMNATAQHFGYPPVDRDRFQSVYGQSTTEDVRTFFPGETVERVEAFYDAHFTDFKGSVEADPAAAQVLSALEERGVRLAVVTNTASALAREILTRSGLWIDTVVGGNDVPQAKPSPDMVHRACELLSVVPRDAVMVGDSHYDQAAALAAGVRFVGLGIDGDERLEHLADLLLLI
jgi:HAD superfamily hydrolase (TIGR01509 family)